MTEGPVIGGPPGPDAQLAGYRIQSVLGEGGMATVYLAERPQGGLCALKVLSTRRGQDLGYAARFKREAQYAEALNHPHILELYEAGEAPDGKLYLAMQYVPGADLAAVLARDGAMELARALALLGQVGDALDCAHAKGLIHRDVKPGNIIVATDGGSAPYAYLTDFGLSKNPDQDSIALTKQGQFVGTTAYTPPEEILAQERDHRIDVYSLGCVLFEALVGEPPFVRDQELDVMYAHIGDPRPRVSDRRPGLPPELDTVIAKAMAISPDDRYSSCTEFIAAASALLPEGAVVPATPSAPPSTVAPETQESPATSAPTSPDPEPTVVPLEPMRLVVRAGPATGRELLIADELLLGRVTTLDGALADDREMSRRHARVHRDAEGGLFVEDQQSANGTFVNGIRIDAPQPLRDGDELRIGSTVFEVAISEQQPTTEPEQPAASESASAVVQERRPGAATSELVVEPTSSEPPKKVVIRLELDLEAGELSVAIEHGPTARIVRDADGWRVEVP